MKILKNNLIILIAGFIVIGTVAVAGNIFTNSDPEPTGITLDDLYNKIASSTEAAGHPLNPTVLSGQVSFKDLETIYNLVVEKQNSIDPGVVASGTKILGVSGTYDISNLIPENVAAGVTYGPNGSLVGTME